MANQFLVEIHNHISQQIEQSRKGRELALSVDDRRRLSFYDGKLDELMKLRRYLNDGFNLNTQRYY